MPERRSGDYGSPGTRLVVMGWLLAALSQGRMEAAAEMGALDDGSDRQPRVLADRGLYADYPVSNYGTG